MNIKLLLSTGMLFYSPIGCNIKILVTLTGAETAVSEMISKK